MTDEERYIKAWALTLLSLAEVYDGTMSPRQFCAYLNELRIIYGDPNAEPPQGVMK